jgi:hypothetical protein
VKIFIWEEIERATDNYHSSGAVVVVAESEESARVLASDKGVKFDSKETVDCVYVIDGEAPEYVGVFPNAGCC